jgi:predicted RNA-binding protein YlqC (UPF0109 family)
VLEVPRPQDLGAELAAWLRAVIAGGPGFSQAGLVSDGSAVRVEARWEEAERLTLVVNVGQAESGRVIGKGGSTLENLRQLTRRVGARLGLPGVSIEVLEA